MELGSVIIKCLFTEKMESSDIEYDLLNKPNYVNYCVITIFSDGKILLNWSGMVQGREIGENGFFLTMRAAKMYVTKNISKSKSSWMKIENKKYENEK
jgi:hypothetical protein